MTVWFQNRFSLGAKRRGFHLVTREVLEHTTDLKKIKKGIFHLFIQHTSASLTINENADPDVRVDFESHFNVMVPENAPHYIHTMEGPDDMPAHLKSSLLGNQITLPIASGSLALGTWQGIYLCEHRDYGGSRNLVATYYGETN